MFTLTTAWNVPLLDGRTDKIELKLHFLTGREELIHNGTTLKSQVRWTLRSAHSVPLSDGRTAEVRVAVSWLKFGLPDCELLVGGTAVLPIGAGSAVTSTKEPIPSWAWPFVIALGAIPIVSLGGALPVIIAMSGISACLWIVRRSTWELPAQVAGCATVGFFGWVALGLLIYGMRILRGY